MAFCKKCGKELQEEEKFCSACGESTETTKENTSSDASSVVNDAYQTVKGKVETILDTKDSSGEYSKEEVQKNKVICALAYLGILFFLPLVACPKGSKYARFHANQGLLILILAVVCNIIGKVLGLIPIVGAIIWILIDVVLLVGLLFGLINTLMGKSKELPYIGGIRIIN